MPADAASLTILGPCSLTANQLQAWLSANGKSASSSLSCTIGQVAAYYLSEGATQGVRGDVAFCQAALETGWFASPAAGPLLAKNNFAGIAVPSAFSAGDGWPTPLLGVRAHIQLLAKVVGGNSTPLAVADVSPSWGGKPASVWAGLNDNWAVPGTTYGQEIVSIFNGILGGGPVLNTSADGTTTVTDPAQGGGASTSGVVNVAAGQIPGIDPKWQASPRVTAGTFTWPVGGQPTSSGLPAADALAAAVTTESTVDLSSSQLSQIQLTLVDPTYSLTGGFPGQIDQQSGDVGPYLQWGKDVMVVAEYQTLDTDLVPCAILTLRTGCLQWMATRRVLKTWTGVSATQWLEQCVSEYNSQLPSGVAPASFLGEETEAYAGGIMANASLPVTQWQSYYDIAQQLCSDEGMWLFESGSTVVFGKPSWLATVAPSFTVGWRNAAGDVQALNVPRYLRSVSVFTGDTVEVDVPRSFGEQVRAGQQFTIAGFTPASGKKWLVTGVQFAYDGGATPVTVQANEIKDPVPAAPGGVAPAPPQTDPTGHAPQATSLQFVQIATTQVGVPYAWGGTSPQAGFDCSGLVMWALGQLGITFPHYSGDQYAACAAVAGNNKGVELASSIYGALLFKDTSSGAAAGEHVAISLGQTRDVGTPNAQVLVLQAPYTGADVGTAWVNISYFNEGATIPELNYGANGAGN